MSTATSPKNRKSRGTKASEQAGTAAAVTPSVAPAVAPTMALQPYTDPNDPQGEQYPISPELIAAAQAARSEASKPGRDRRFETQWVSITLLIPADYNPRQISDFQLTRLRESLKKFGLVQPIIVNTFPGREGVIVGGHQRLKAAHIDTWDEIGVVWVFHPLAEEQALNIGLNQIGGEWDTTKLAQVIAELHDKHPDDLPYAGFDEDQLQKILADFANSHSQDSEGQHPDEDNINMPTGVTRVQPGDLWQLGRHRLLCGDARNWENWVELLGGFDRQERADTLWTDPPYGVGYIGKTKKKLTIQNDQLDEAGLEALLTDAFACANRALKPGASVYVCEPPGPLSILFRVGFRQAGWRFHETLVWVKDQFVLGHSDYHLRHETIIFGYSQGAGRRGRGGAGWYGDNARTSVFEVPRPKASTEHPTTKPSALVGLMLMNSAPYRGIVVDCFAGAGCTVLACEEMGRAARAMELDPRYATVILDRWEKLSGEQGVMLSRRGTGIPYSAPPEPTPPGATVTEEPLMPLLAGAYREE